MLKQIKVKEAKDASKKLDALGTIEVVIIIAVLIAVALIFKDEITNFAKELMDKAFDSSILDQI